VQISVERVENPRAAANRSGTLSLELWALPEPFAGGRFEGHHLAGVEIGCVSGQCELALQPIEVAFTPPPAGEWQIGLMLREWTADGFVTRDFANFAARYVSALAVEQAPEPVVEQAIVLVVEENVSTLVETAPAAEAEVARVAATARVPRTRTRAAATAKRISINSADLEELAAVKGLSAKLAERIVRKRPFHSLAELVEIKGLGEKVLAKIRTKLKL
jgi:DNA uptake protein ComE-like DNA-binding protein